MSVRGTDDGCCGIFFLKYVLYIFNFILLLSGAAILAVGLWTYFAKQWMIGLLGERGDLFIILMYSLIGIGGFIVLFVFSIGCCGSVRKNRACLMLYAVLLLFVFILEAGSGVLTYMYEITINKEVGRIVNGTVTKRYATDSGAKYSVDYMQTYNQCCGSTSYTDWVTTEWYRTIVNGSQSVPDSCCKTPSVGCAARNNANNANNIFMRGCLLPMEEEFRVQLNIMGAMGMGLCCLQIFGIIFACCLAKKVRSVKQRQQRNLWQ